MKPHLAFCIPVILFVSACLPQKMYAQTSKNIQPKIIVIPRTRDDESIKALYDTSMNYQIALAKINEAFEKRGANLVMFAPKLKQAEQNSMINKSSGNTDDYKSLVLQNSGADIYVEAKLDVVRHAARNANSVTVILEGYQIGTGNAMGSKVGNSRMNQTADIGLLTMQAMDSISEGFLNLMQQKFDDIVENGQSVYVEFTVSPQSKYNFDSEIGTQNKLLSEMLEEWFEKHALKGVYNSQGVITNKMIFSDVRIPLKNPANPQSNYTGQTLTNEILKYCRSIGLQPKREIANNNKILITIQ